MVDYGLFRRNRCRNLSVEQNRRGPHRHRFRHGCGLVPLAELEEGQKGFVVEVRGDKRLVQRLSDLGITPNTDLTVTRVAPADGPVEVEVRGSKLILGKKITKNVFVKVG